MSKDKNIPDQSQARPGYEYKMHPQPEIIRKGYIGSERLKGKTSLITGGDSGIGRSVAVHFAREGAHVGIIYLEETEDALETKKMVEKEGVKCVLVAGNLESEEFCKEAVESVISELGKINILVNNAAMQFPRDQVEDITFEQFRRTFSTNIFPYFYITKICLETMPKGGAIINTTSVTAYRGSEHLLDYSSTKGAVVSFTRSLSKMLVDRNIRVNSVAPGPIWTPLIPSTFNDVSEFGKDVPMGRPGQPSEVGPAYVFLASADSSYITGQVIHINGGEIVGG